MYQLAERNYKEAIVKYRQVDDVLGRANCTKGLGDLAREMNDFPRAERYYKDAESDYISLGNVVCLANLDKARGDVCQAGRKYDLAERYYKKALLNYRRGKNRLGEARCVKSRGDVCLRDGRFDWAKIYYEEAVELFGSDDPIMVAASRKGLGDVALAGASYADARTQYLEALVSVENLHDEFGIMHCLIALGEAEIRLGHGYRSEAKKRLVEANAILKRKFIDDRSSAERIEGLLSSISNGERRKGLPAMEAGEKNIGGQLAVVRDEGFAAGFFHVYENFETPGALFPQRKIYVFLPRGYEESDNPIPYYTCTTETPHFSRVVLQIKPGIWRRF
jgi:tetratricopeptide (TPR) repeat protein